MDTTQWIMVALGVALLVAAVVMFLRRPGGRAGDNDASATVERTEDRRGVEPQPGRDAPGHAAATPTHAGERDLPGTPDEQDAEPYRPAAGAADEPHTDEATTHDARGTDDLDIEHTASDTRTVDADADAQDGTGLTHPSDDHERPVGSTQDRGGAQGAFATTSYDDERRTDEAGPVAPELTDPGFQSPGTYRDADDTAAPEPDSGGSTAVPRGDVTQQPRDDHGTAPREDHDTLRDDHGTAPSTFDHEADSRQIADRERYAESQPVIDREPVAEDRTGDREADRTHRDADRAHQDADRAHQDRDRTHRDDDQAYRDEERAHRHEPGSEQQLVRDEAKLDRPGVADHSTEERSTTGSDTEQRLVRDEAKLDRPGVADHSTEERLTPDSDTAPQQEHPVAAGGTTDREPEQDRRDAHPVFAESIYGSGSAEPLEDGSGPAGWEIKGNSGSMLFHTPDSPSYAGLRAEVWFDSEETARAAGFAHWDRRRR